MTELINIVDKIYSSSTFAKFNAILENNYESLIELLCTIAEIPSPSFHEMKKAVFVKNKMVEYGLGDVRIDSQNNVIGRFYGKQSNHYIALFAHIDTVFPLETKLNVEKKKNFFACPGIGDNSSSVAALLTIIKIWIENKFLPEYDVIFVANACEEGLGDLKGIKTFFKEYIKDVFYDQFPSAVISLDGTLNDITNVGIGSKRYKLSVKSKGGHSWGNFGDESAIHLMAKCISEITSINVPKKPKTTFNIGVVRGGISVNTIAPSAECLIDLRSEDKNELNKLNREVELIIKNTFLERNSSYSLELVGDRPASFIEEKHPIVQLAKLSGIKQGIKTDLRASSTDANIPMSLNIPAITIGVYTGLGAHTDQERMNPDSFKQGIPYAILLILSVVEWLK